MLRFRNSCYPQNQSERRCVTALKPICTLSRSVAQRGLIRTTDSNQRESKGFESKGIKGNQRDSLKEIFLSRRGDEEVNDYVDVHSWFPRLPSRFVLNLFAAELEDELN